MAGTVINDAARLLGLLDRRQIAFTEVAHDQIVDMVDDPGLSEMFRQYSGIRIKHDRLIDVYQYIDSEESALNSEEPSGTDQVSGYERGLGCLQ